MAGVQDAYANGAMDAAPPEEAVAPSQVAPEAVPGATASSEHVFRAGPDCRAEFWRCLELWYKTGAFCDLDLVCGAAAAAAGGGFGGDAVVRCHRLVLGGLSRTVAASLRQSACGPAAAATLGGGDPDSDPVAVVHLPDHDAASVRHFVDTVYASLAQTGVVGDADFSASADVLATLGVDLGRPFFDPSTPYDDAVAPAAAARRVGRKRGRKPGGAAGQTQYLVAKVEPADVGGWQPDQFDEGMLATSASGGDLIGHQDYGEEEDLKDVKPSRRGRKSKKRRYGYVDDDFIDDGGDDDEDDDSFDDDDFEPDEEPRKRRGPGRPRKNKSEDAGSGGGRRRRRNARKAGPSAPLRRMSGPTLTLAAKIRGCEGGLAVALRREPLAAEEHLGPAARAAAQYMCLLGLRRVTKLEGQPQQDFQPPPAVTTEAVPLAWTPDPSSDWGPEEALRQYEDLVGVARSCLGLSELEAGYQEEALERMEMGWYRQKGLRARIALGREHAAKTPDQLAALLSDPEVARLAEPTTAPRPHFCGGMQQEEAATELSLVGAIPVGEVEAVALLSFAGGAEDDGAGGPDPLPVVRCLCLNPNVSREEQGRSLIRTLFDVWSLNRVDMKYVDACPGIVDRYAELAPAGDLVLAVSRLLSDHDGSLRRQAAGTEPAVCGVCGAVLPTATVDDLVRADAHRRGHRYVDEYPCSCPALWSGPAERRAHVEREHLLGLARCDLCEFHGDPEALAAHAERAHAEVACPTCGQVEPGSDALRWHAETRHPEQRPKRQPGSGGGGGGGGGSSSSEKVPQTCHVCGKAFDKHANFHVHMRIHNTYTCDVCGKVIHGYNIMRAHKRKAHPDPNKVKAYPCEVCGKMMSSQMRMKEHILRIHAPDHERPHLCPDCGRGFARKGELDAHRNVVHIKNRPYACRFGCGEAFNHYATRGDHEKSKHGMRFPKSKTQDQMEKIFRNVNQPT